MDTWTLANHAFLDAELARLRLLLARRALVLRSSTVARVAPDAIAEAELEEALEEDRLAREKAFLDASEEAALLARKIEHARDVCRRRAERLDDAGRSSALDELATRFGLSAFERDVVLLAVAPHLDGRIARAFAYVQDDPRRSAPTQALALDLFCEDDDARILAKRSLGADRPLRRYRLIEAAGSGPLLTRALDVDERVAGYVSGTSTIDARVARWTRPSTGAALGVAQREVVDKAVAWLRSLPRGGPRPVLNLVGKRGSGRAAIAHAAFESVGGSVRELRAARLPTAPDELADALRLLVREATLLRAAYYVEADGGAVTTSILESLDTLLVAASEEPLRIANATVVVRVPKPTAAARVEMWRGTLGRRASALNGHVEQLAQQFDLGPGAIGHVARMAEARVSMRSGGEELTKEDLWGACRDHVGAGLDDLATRIEPAFDWDDIVLPADVTEMLRALAAQVATRGEVYERWGFGAKMPRGRGISALFGGSSGTGKTMAAEVLARSLELDLYRIDLASVVNKYVGETEKNIRRVFDAADATGAILFFDEADALFAKRTDVKTSNDRYANLEVDYLLQRMEEYRGLAILATNRRDVVDRAFLRRLRFVVDFPKPEAHARAEIWRRVFPARAPVEDIDVHALARLDVAGGNIRNIAVNAAFAAASERSPITMRHVMRAARREYAKLDKLVTEAEFGAHFEGASP